jgi:DNA-binding MarR family transcriptional regulator
MTSKREPEDGVGELRALLLAGQRFRQALADRFGLSLSEAVVLGHLADAGGQLMPSELTERMLVGSGTLTAIIDRLADNGHVQRSPHPRDRRRIHITLTAAGRRVVRYAQQHLEQAETAAQQVPASPLRALATALHTETERGLRRRP